MTPEDDLPDHSLPDDDSIDARLRARVMDWPADPAVLSARVLTRLAQQPAPPRLGLPWPGAMLGAVLADPRGLGALTGAAMAAGVALGYAALPLLDAELALALYLGESLTLRGGF